MDFNPVLTEIHGLSPAAKSALGMAGHVLPPVQTNPIEDATSSPPIGTLLPQETPPAYAPMSAAAPPPSLQPRGTLEGDQYARGTLLNEKPGVEQIAGKVENSRLGQAHPIAGKILGGIAQGGALLGDTLLHAALPRFEQEIPGTEGQHELQLSRANTALGQDVGNAEKEAQAKNLELQPQLKVAQQELAHEKQNETEQHHQQQNAATLAQHGFKLDENGDIQPLSYEEMSEPQQAVHDLKASQDELAQASAALKKAQNDPNSPQFKLAQQRVNNATQSRSVAMQRLGLSEKQFELRSQGTINGVPAEGAMISDEGKPVGTAFQQNVRPTGQERNKADMAHSASEQLADIKSIMQKHPTLFGPGYGQASEFKQWIGSQDPDAQRFLTARTIAADHLAGTFGGRSEAALNALDKAIGQFKDNPKAAIAGIDQLTKANTTFQKAGTVKTAGSNATSGGPKEGDTKKNSAGDDIVFKGGKWQPK